MSENRRRNGRKGGDRYGGNDDWDDGNYQLQQEDEVQAIRPAAEEEPQESNVRRAPGGAEGIFRDEASYEEEDDDDEFGMSLAELLYSTSSFYAIMLPGKHFENEERENATL
jgi:hypothetical protein